MKNSLNTAAPRLSNNVGIRTRRLASGASVLLLAAAVGLPLIVPSTAMAMEHSSDSASTAFGGNAQQPVITADADVKLVFERATVQTIAGPTPAEIRAASVGVSLHRLLTDHVVSAPLEHVEMASPFGERISPITGQVDEFHRGEDLVAPCGTKVYAAAPGKVTFNGWHPYGGGNRIEIDHTGGVKTTYNHLDKSLVKEGDDVVAGDLIGIAGTTGSSTGCHLHFEVMVNGDVTHPAPWLKDPLVVSDKSKSE